MKIPSQRCGVSLLNNKAREVLDLYLSSESTEFQARVYEIINRSGLEPDDPMFLVLALTGQMRVFLEAAPEELGQLLTEWKGQSAKSLSELYAAITIVKETQQQQADTIARNLSGVSSKCVSEIKSAGMATVSAIAEANQETLDQVIKTKKQNEDLSKTLTTLLAEAKADREKNLENHLALMEWINKTNQRQEKVNERISDSISEVKKIKQNKIWLRIADGFLSLPALVAFGLILVGGTWWIASQRYNHPNNVFGRDVVDWNIERINHCQETENPKCTVWIVPPGSPQRQE
ncbi:MAG: DUF6753 family protein [Waterburya sp.]